MNPLIHSSNHYLCRVPYPLVSPVLTNKNNVPKFLSTLRRSRYPIACATSNEEVVEEVKVVESNTNEESTSSAFSTPIDKELKKVGYFRPSFYNPSIFILNHILRTPIL